MSLNPPPTSGSAGIPKISGFGPHEPVAIVGIGCRLPGGANDPREFWRLLCDGVDAVTEVPPDRWNADKFHDRDATKPGKSVSRWGGFVENIDKFDPGFFGISPREAAVMDPQQRLLLEAAWDALEDGGQSVEGAAGTDVGVFVGISTLDYARLQSSYDDLNGLELHSATGGAASIAANRISYCLDLHGPSVSVDTACSSSLVALHFACRSLRNGECKTALAGGVNAMLVPDTFVSLSHLGALSPEGRCKAFDASGKGFVRGEGAGVVVLKPLSAAQADGDAIYAIILGSAVNQDGHTNGIAVPNPQAQIDVVRSACEDAGILPSQIQYVEAHGTGTPVGDPLEAHALGTAIGNLRPAGSPLLIGSVKTNIGHLEAAAGICGIIKLALALKHGALPASLHYRNPSPNIPFEKLNLQVQQNLGLWPESSGPRLAGINSFGFGGTNAHAVLASVPSVEDAVHPADAKPARAELLALSATSPEALQAQARRYIDFLRQESAAGRERIADIAYTAGARRRHHAHRLTVAAASSEEAAQLLEAAITEPFVQKHPQPAPVFVFSGQGPQWWAMGRQLLAGEPVFRRKIEECDAILRTMADWSLIKEMTAEESASRINETCIAQPAICALQIALAALWQSWGIRPAAIVGHSVGEIAGAHLAGALSLEDAMKVIFHRGRSMTAAKAGRMLAAALPPQEAEAMLSGVTGVSVAAFNSPFSVTFSGDAAPLEEISRRLETQGIFNRFLNVTHGFHSHLMDFVEEDLTTSLSEIAPRIPEIPFISTVSGRASNGDSLDAHYWWHNVRKPVRFTEAMDALIREGHSVFLELGPHPALATSMHECLRYRSQKGTVLASLRRDRDERRTMLESLGTLHALGHPVSWSAVCSRDARCVRLPSYAWQNERYWNEAEECRDARLLPSDHPLLGSRLSTGDPTWQVKLDLRTFPYLDDHRVHGRVIFPAAGYVEMGLNAACVLHGGERGMILEDFEFQRPLILPKSDEVQTAQLAFQHDDASFTISARGADASWADYCVGKARPVPEGDSRAAVRFDMEAWKSGMTEVTTTEGYRSFEEIGLQYGPAFQGIAALWRRPGEAVAQVRLPECAQDRLAEYRLHPALLDSCFQTLLATIPEVDELRRRLFLPFQIDRIRFCQRTGTEVWCHVRLVKQTSTVVEGTFQLVDAEGTLLAEITGFRCRATMARAEGSETETLYENLWELKPLPGREFACRPADYLPALSKIATCASDVAKVSDAAAAAEMDGLFAEFVLQAFAICGWRPAAGHAFTTGDVVAQTGIPAQREALVGRLLQLLADCGHLEARQGGWLPLPPALESDVLAAWRAAVARRPAFIAELMLIEKCGRALPDMLRGQIEAAQLLLEGGGLALVEHLLADSPSFQPLNVRVGDLVSASLEGLPRGRRIRILEMGAGTGGLIAHLVRQLQPASVEYWFTDPAEKFVQPASERWREHPSLRCQVLDVKRRLDEQSFAPHGFDIVIGPGIFRGDDEQACVVSCANGLLAPEGLLLLVPRTTPQRWLEFLFGCLHEDIGHMSEAGSGEELTAAGFTQITSTGPVLMARAPAGAQADTAIKAPAPATTGRWLLFADESGTAPALATKLREREQSCVLVSCGECFERISPDRFRIRAGDPEDMMQLFEVLATEIPPLCGVVHLWNLDAPQNEFSTDELRSSHARGVHSLMHIVQSMVGVFREKVPTLTPHLWLVTRGAQSTQGESAPVSVAQSSAWGLGRVILSEHAEPGCRMVDLDPVGSDRDVDHLLDELLSGDGEEEVIYRAEARMVRRMVRSTLIDSRKVTDTTPSFSLEIPRLGSLDNLTFLPRQRRAPGPGEVEIEVRAAALNFRDTMKALGIYPTEVDDAQVLGDECAGTVVAVGEGVTGISPGDEVLTIAAGCFASHVTMPAAFVARKPADMSFDEAVTIPIPFLTAWYALHHLARIAPGERVLIHAATGGVGLAAVQVAQQAGAEVFATAGSAEKRDFLRALGVKHVMDSRTLRFADEIMEITGGEGVDMVLNSLAGEAIPRSLSTLRSYGRFLEIGKRDIYQNSRLGLRPFRNNLSYFAIDLARTMMDRTALVGALFGDLMKQFTSGKLRPLPLRTFPMGAAVSAFRCLAQARHIGKVVLSLDDRSLPLKPAARPGSVTFVENASYLVTGGLGGFGLELAKWLVQNGARHLVLVGRSGAATEETRKAVSDLQAAGSTVQVMQADISREADVSRVLAEIKASLPPLRGVFHTAMVLDDGMLVSQSATRFSTVMEPKVSGAWNLHALTGDCALDHFVLFSSISAAIGTPGQANYAAANMFLDMLAAHRRTLGQPGLSVAWGALGDAGYLVHNPKVQEHLNRMGMAGLAAADALKMLGRLLQNGMTQMTVARVDWRQLASVFPPVGSSLRFCQVAGKAVLGSAGTPDGAKWRDAILSAASEDRLPMLVTALRETIARVLRTAPEKLDIQRPLSELGLDSLMAFEVINRIETDFAMSIPTGKLMLSDNITKLSEVTLGFLSAQGAMTATEAPQETPTAAPDDGTAALLEQLDDLTDAQVDSMLGDLAANAANDR